ncbi:MAG TPA: hypothetical protein VF862_08390, partial [Gemmatimonadales bacterium]
MTHQQAAVPFWQPDAGGRGALALALYLRGIGRGASVVVGLDRAGREGRRELAPRVATEPFDPRPAACRCGGGWIHDR